jgi:TRAP-type C4-dicarboxylate transport system substrate-binding protein
MLMPAYAQTFKIATILPDGTYWMNKMRKAGDEISEKTQGRVVFRFYPGGIMGNASSVLRKIRIGQLQGGAITGGELTEIYPDSHIYSVPFAFRSLEEVDYVRSKMDKIIIDAIRENGFISFGLSEAGFAYIMSNKPIRCFDDLKEHKIWSPQGDDVSRTVFESLGVSPIQVPVTDVLTGLQTGLIDTVGTSPIGAIALQWHTRVKYMTDIPLIYLYATLVIQRKAFESLSPEDQDAVRDVLVRTFNEIGMHNRQENDAARQALKNQGIEFVSPPKEQSDRWNSRVTEIIESLSGQQVFSRKMLDMLRGYLREYRQTRSTSN